MTHLKFYIKTENWQFRNLNKLKLKRVKGSVNNCYRQILLGYYLRALFITQSFNYALRRKAVIIL